MGTEQGYGEIPGNWLSDDLIKPLLDGITAIFPGREKKKETIAIVAAIRNSRHDQAAELAKNGDLEKTVARAVDKAHEVQAQFDADPKFMAGSPARQASLVIFDHYKIEPEQRPI